MWHLPLVDADSAMMVLLWACAPDVRFATEVVDAPGADPTVDFGDPRLAANGVPASISGGSTDVYSLTAERPWLTLGFEGSRILNVDGPDFVVFENPFVIGAGPDVFVDPVVVEVSADGMDFVPFPHLAPVAYTWDPEAWFGFAGVTPTMLDLAPADDPASGGDRFDLDQLDESPIKDQIMREGILQIRLSPGGPTDPIADGPDIDAVYAWSFDD